MHAEVFTVATTGEVRDGLLSMARGGWEGCEITTFPAQVDLVLVGVIVYAPEDYGRHHVISVFVEAGDGRSGALGNIQVTPSKAAAVVKTPFTFPLTLTLEGPVVLSLTAKVERGPMFGPTQFEARRAQTDEPLDVPLPQSDRIRYARAAERDAGGSAPAAELPDEFDWLE